jgi:hypothetical protein
MGKLTARQVLTHGGAGLLADGDGLYLQVTASGAKSWIYRYQIAGRRRDMGLGSTTVLTLAEARDAARDCRKLVKQGIDPLDARQAERAAKAIADARALTFRQCAEKYIEDHRAGWRSAKHAAQWPSTLQTYVYPVFGNLPVQAIDTALVMKAVEPIWATRTETAGRVRGRIESVLDWATARGYRQGENPARWRGHLENLLPKKTKVARIEHHAAMPYVELPGFMAELRRQEGIGAKALEFAILTAARTGEVIGATWAEIDLEGRLWVVPGERMKGRAGAPCTAQRARAGDPAGHGRGTNGRSYFPRHARRPAARQKGVLDDIAPDGARRFDGAWFPIDVLRLVRRADEFPE